MQRETKGLCCACGPAMSQQDDAAAGNNRHSFQFTARSPRRRSAVNAPKLGMRECAAAGGGVPAPPTWKDFTRTGAVETPSTPARSVEGWARPVPVLARHRRDAKALPISAGPPLPPVTFLGMDPRRPRRGRTGNPHWPVDSRRLPRVRPVATAQHGVFPPHPPWRNTWGELPAPGCRVAARLSS